MAATKASLTAKDADALAPRALDKLSEMVYISNAPASEGQSTPRTDPELIILLSWMDARLPHIQKYISGYAQLFPHSDLLLIRSFQKSWGSSPARRLASLEPAAEELRRRGLLLGSFNEGETSKGKARPRVLVHLLSNGGAFNLAYLLRAAGAGNYDAYLPNRVGRNVHHGTGKVFPAMAYVFDSGPGFAWLRNSVTAFAMPFKNPFARALITVIVTFWYFAAFLRRHIVSLLLWRRVPRTEARLMQVLNDTSIVGRRPRLYFCSDGDKIIESPNIIRHAEDWRKRGGTAKVVRKGKETGHVMSMRTDPEGYWREVKEVWELGLGEAESEQDDIEVEKQILESSKKLD